MNIKESNMIKTLDIYELIQNIKKHFWILILSILLSGVLGYGGTKCFIEPQYEASITMIVNTRNNTTDNVTNDNITSAQNLVSTYSVIIKSNTILNQVIDRLNLDMNYSELEDNVYVNAVDDTQIMRIAVRNSDKLLAKKIVNEIADIAPTVIVDIVEAGSCKVVSTVDTSEKPVTPNVLKNVLLASAIGGILATIGITFVSLLKVKNIVDANDLNNCLDLPVLGIIPEIEGDD